MAKGVIYGVLLALFGGATDARGQSLSARYAYFPHADLTLEGAGKQPFQIRTQSIEAEAAYTFRFRQGATTLRPSVSYQGLFFDYRDAPMAIPTDQAHLVQHAVELRHGFLERWAVLAILAPGYADDFKGKPSLDAFNVTAVLAGIFGFSDGSWVGLGAALDYNFGSPRVLPVAGFLWKIIQGLELDGLVPININLTYLPLRWLGLRLTAEFCGNRYHGDPEIYRVDNPALNYSVGLAKLGVRVYVLPFLHLTVDGGYSFYRRFEFSDGGDVVSTYNAGNGAVFGVALGVGG